MSVGTGTTLGGRYELAERIATGGMGEVWRAHDGVLGRDVAVKAVHASFADDPTFLERFRAEARHTAALSHPGIAGVYDYGEEDGTAYLVMELVEGEPLSSLLERAGRLPAAQAMDIVGQAAMALQAAHDAGVVHRDVKPGNLIVRRDGVVKITDFGIARAADAVPLTRTGQVMGTAQYLSPEQAAGQRVGAASDVYSLGVVGYECLAGRRPFDGDNPVAVGLAHVHEPPPPLPADVPEPAREVVGRCLAKDPPARFGSARELGRAALAARSRLDAAGDAATVPVGRAPTEVLGSSGAAAGAGRPQATRAYTQAVPPRETRRPSKPRGQRRVRNSLIAVGVAVVALAVALSLLARGCGATPSVTVPRVTGVPVDQATNTLHGQGLRADVTKAHSTQPTGNVTHQDPGPHVQAAQGSTVQLTVSSGPQLVDVDASDYLGKSYDDVNGDLKDKGLAVSRHDEAVSGKTPGTVVAVNPHGKVRKGTNITVTVAVAPAQPTSQPGNGPHHDNGKHKGEHKNNGNNGNGPGTPSPPSPPMTPSPPMQPSPPGGDDNDQGQD